MSTPRTWIDGFWHEGNPPILGPMTHGTWMASVAFDGARAFEGVTPDLDRHCARAVASARAIGLDPRTDPADIVRLALEGVRQFPHGTELYIRPLFWAEDGFVEPDPDSTRFMLTLFELALAGAERHDHRLHGRPTPPASGHGPHGLQGVLPLPERPAHDALGPGAGATRPPLCRTARTMWRSSPPRTCS